jgi:hypothetical protein
MRDVEVIVAHLTQHIDVREAENLGGIAHKVDTFALESLGAELPALRDLDLAVRALTDLRQPALQRYERPRRRIVGTARPRRPAIPAELDLRAFE